MPRCFRPLPSLEPPPTKQLRDGETYSIVSSDGGNGVLVGIDLVALEFANLVFLSNTAVLVLSTLAALGEDVVGRCNAGIKDIIGNVLLVDDNVGVLDDVAGLNVADLEVGWSGLSNWCCQSTGEESCCESDEGLGEEHVGWFERLMRRCGRVDADEDEEKEDDEGGNERDLYR